MNSTTFLTDFLQLSDIRTLLFIGVLIGIFILIRQIEKKKVAFYKRMVLGTVLGFCLGIIIQAVSGFASNPEEITWMSEVSNWYGLVGNGYMDLLKMLVVPLIFFSIVRVIISMEGNNIGTLAAKTIGMLVGTTLIAATLGTILASIFQVGTRIPMDGADATIREMSSMSETLRGLLPSNIVSSMAEGEVVAVVIFATFVGIAIRRQKKKYSELMDRMIQWNEGCYKIILSIAMTIIKFMPYAVVALLSNTITSRGISVLASVGLFIVELYLGVALMLLVHMLIVWTKGITPIEYLRKAMQPLILAFTSRSSIGTLPVMVETLHEKFEVEEGIASFVGSLGTNMGMNGCAGLYSALVAVMLAQMTGMSMDLGFFIMLAIIITISSFGIAGLPGAATLSISVVIAGMGMGEYFPLVGAIIAIDPILDMGRTMLNVSGTMTSAIVIGK